MKVDIEFIGNLRKSNIFNEVKQVPISHNCFEYCIAKFEEGIVNGEIYIDNEILDIDNNIIGYFGIDFTNKVFAYKLKDKRKEVKK